MVADPRTLEQLESDISDGFDSWRQWVPTDPSYTGLAELVRRLSEMEQALDRIWKIAMEYDAEVPTFSAAGALETIADIASDFEEVAPHAD